jgi:DNA-binding NarL/FixJ family response regulator
MSENQRAIPVSIVEDDVKFRSTLARLIDSTEGFCCVSQHPDAENALKELPVSKPEVVLMDINMPGMSGVDCVRPLKKLLPSVQIVMLTVYDDADLIFKALSAGASGYLLKQSTPDQIVHAVRNVHTGGSPMSSQIARKVVASFQQQPAGMANYQKLTEREQEVLNQLAHGSTYAEIAEALKISYDTVRAHIRNIYEKLHVQSATQAVTLHLQFAGKDRN